MSGVKVQGQSAVTRSRRCGIVESDGNVDGEMSVRLAGRLLARRTAPPRVGLLQSLTAPSFLAKRTLCSPSGEPPKFGGWRGRRQLPTLSAIRAFDAADLENARIDLWKLSSSLVLPNPLMPDGVSCYGFSQQRIFALAHHWKQRIAWKWLWTLRNEARRCQRVCGRQERAPRGALPHGRGCPKLYRLEEAEKQLTSVLADDDTHWRARFHLALVRLSAEEPDFDEARALLTRVLADEPTHPTAQTMLDKLRERRAAAELKLTAFDGDDIAKGTSGA